jgi:TonB-dependent receptor
MRSLVRRIGVAAAVAVSTTIVASTVGVSDAYAQTGTIVGRVVDTTGAPLSASIRVLGTNLGGDANVDGQYEIIDVPSGARRLVVHYLGYQTDTFSVTIGVSQTVRHNVVLRPDKHTLSTVVVKGQQGANETVAGALQAQKNADNIITVMSADEIASLPNSNAAEALARLPGVTAERDEGEGKYVEIRGTPPDFQHVTIDGADVPGTLATDVRAVKLDDVPADVLGSIEVSKTLTADQSADAIGGSVNLVTRVPEGAPHGYISGQALYTFLENANLSGQGSLTYGGRIGPGRKLGFLVSGSYDRTNRTINDVEPSYTAERIDPETGGYMVVPNGSNFSHTYPSEWSQREYNYYRTRYGLAGDLDYRFSPTSSVYLKGLWSAFFDQANRWETNVSADYGNGQDTVIGGQHQVPNFKVKNTVANRGPIEHTWGFTGGTKQDVGPVHLTVDLNYAGSSATTNNHLEDTYKWSQNDNFGYTYNSSKLNPEYFPIGTASTSSAQIRALIQDPAQWNLSEIDTDNEISDGSIIGARADALYPYTIGSLPASTKVGLKYRNEHKGYLDNEPQYAYQGNATLAQFLGSYTDNSFYSHICPGCYTNAPYGDIPSVQRYFNANGGAANQALFMTIPGQILNDNLNSFAGTEQVTAAYIMQTLDIRALHINAGLRVENTSVGYVGHSADSTDPLGTALVRGNKSYTNLFPSVQLRYAIDENTNVRAAFTRGIARPDYIQLAPSLNAIGAEAGSISNAITIGNPALLPEYSWNTDVLFEHFFRNIGVLSGGAFYKQISDFIFQRKALYDGPLAQYQGYYVNQYQNGPDAELWGVEADYQQHLAFLPGALGGIGFDVNWTHVESRATVPQDTTLTYTNNSLDSTYTPYRGHPFRHSPIPRQFPNIFNAALLYDYHTVSARISGQYTAASIYQYGEDGTSNPTSGDTWNYPHWQIDCQASWAVFKRTQIRIAGTNINNEYFGFFTGLSGHGHSYNNQREYYGPTWAVGLRQGF